MCRKLTIRKKQHKTLYAFFAKNLLKLSLSQKNILTNWFAQNQQNQASLKPFHAIFQTLQNHAQLKVVLRFTRRDYMEQKKRIDVIIAILLSKLKMGLNLIKIWNIHVAIFILDTIWGKTLSFLGHQALKTRCTSILPPHRGIKVAKGPYRTQKLSIFLKNVLP